MAATVGPAASSRSSPVPRVLPASNRSTDRSSGPQLSLPAHNTGSSNTIPAIAWAAGCKGWGGSHGAGKKPLSRESSPGMQQAAVSCSHVDKDLRASVLPGAMRKPACRLAGAGCDDILQALGRSPAPPCEHRAVLAVTKGKRILVSQSLRNPTVSAEEHSSPD